MTTAAPPIRVLLVDDHPLVRGAVRQAIAAPDIEVVGEAGTTDEATALARELLPDLVLLDLDLPGRSGFEFLRQARTEWPDMQVVILTVSATDRDLIEAIRAGAAGYMTKDVSPDAIAGWIRAARTGDVPIPGRLAAETIARLSPDDRGRAGGAGGNVDSASGLARLTDREREILTLISEGRTDRQVAIELRLSVRTVEAHVGSILRRLSVRHRADASRIWRDRGRGRDPADA